MSSFYYYTHDTLLNNNNLIDFDQIKPVINPPYLWWWYDDNLHQFLNDNDFLTLTSSLPSSPSSSICSSLCSPDDSSATNTTTNTTTTTTTMVQSTAGEELSLFEPLTKTTNDKPYICSYCSRAFSRRHDLQRHSRVHTGVKPYSCPCCQKSFARSDARGRHFHSDPQCSNSIQVQKLLMQRNHKKKKGSRINKKQEFY